MRHNSEVHADQFRESQIAAVVTFGGLVHARRPEHGQAARLHVLGELVDRELVRELSCDVRLQPRAQRAVDVTRVPPAVPCVVGEQAGLAARALMSMSADGRIQERHLRGDVREALQVGDAEVELVLLVRLAGRLRHRQLDNAAVDDLVAITRLGEAVAEPEIPLGGVPLRVPLEPGLQAAGWLSSRALLLRTLRPPPPGGPPLLPEPPLPSSSPLPSLSQP